MRFLSRKTLTNLHKEHLNVNVKNEERNKPFPKNEACLCVLKTSKHFYL